MDDVVAGRFSCRWVREKWCRAPPRSPSWSGSRHDIEGGHGVWGMDIGQATADPAAIASSLLDVFQEDRMGWGNGGTVPLCFSASVLVHREKYKRLAQLVI